MSVAVNGEAETLVALSEKYHRHTASQSSPQLSPVTSPVSRSVWEKKKKGRSGCDGVKENLESWQRKFKKPINVRLISSSCASSHNTSLTACTYVIFCMSIPAVNKCMAQNDLTGLFYFLPV